MVNGMLARMTTYQQMDKERTNWCLNVCLAPIIMCWFAIVIHLAMQNTDLDKCPDLYKWFCYDVVIIFVVPIVLLVVIMAGAYAKIKGLFKMGKFVRSLWVLPHLSLGIWGFIIYVRAGGKECAKDPQAIIDPITVLLVLSIFQTMMLWCTFIAVMVLFAKVSDAREDDQQGYMGLP